MAIVDRGLWQGIIERVVAVGGNIIRPWFTHLDPIALEHGLLEIRVPGRAEQDYCRRHATQLFTEAAQAATGRLVGVCFLTGAEAEDVTEEVPALEATPETPAFDPDYTFDNFVAGPCNRLAHAASVAVSDGPGQSYNPLFLHGSVGLGKTHLQHAACRQIAQRHPEGQVCLLSCETFVNHFIEAVERGKLHEFRYRYRHADVLAIDDIQFLAGHEQSQEEFFHTFNTLYQERKQIIVSCDRGPGEIQGLEERLISRFNWGLVARIDRPCYETRLAIVHKKAKMRKTDLPDDVACFIAGAVESNTRELEGAIAKVAMLASVSDRPISMELAQEALGADPGPRDREVSIEDILSAVTARFNVRLADLQSRKRSRSIAFPRQICMYLARNLTRHSLEEIGGYFGGRDHTTVLHANRTIDNQRTRDPELQATLERISRSIRNA
jgi:chromosomal replication initiator protein